jgi:tetratricopeptide (TPR) repeat protein
MRALDATDPTLWVTQGNVTSLGEIARYRGDFTAARAHLELAIKTWDDIGKSTPVTEARLMLARVASSEGKHEEAARLSRIALHDYEQTQDARVDLARSVLARALVDSDHLDDARAALAPSLEHVGTIERIAIKLDVMSSNAAIELAAGDTASAMEELTRALELAQRTGAVPQQLELELAVARAELHAGKPRARARLAALVKRAAAAHFGDVARQGAATMK